MDKPLMIKSRQFCKLKILVSDVMAWFEIIYSLTGIDDLSIALDLCDSYKTTDEQKTAVVMIKALICQEASGNIIPPFNLCKTYREMFSN
jgi:hypothetical protein